MRILIAINCSEVKMARKNFLVFVLYGILAVFIFYFGFKYALPVALPFLVAFFTAASVQGASARFSARTGIKKRYVSLLFGLLFFAFVGFLVFLFVSKLWGELGSIARSALEAREDIMGLTGDLLLRAQNLIESAVVPFGIVCLTIALSAPKTSA